MKKIIVGQIGNLHDHSKDIMLTLKRLPEHFNILGFVPESEDDYFKEYSNYGKNVESFYKGNPLNQGMLLFPEKKACGFFLRRYAVLL